MINTIILQAAGAQGGSSASMFIMLGFILLIMWLFMIRPQRKQQKAMEEMRNALKKGDKVVTAGGIYGTIAEVSETTVLIKVDGEVKLRVDKTSIQKDMTDPSNAPAKKEEKKEEK